MTRGAENLPHIRSTEKHFRHVKDTSGNILQRHKDILLQDEKLMRDKPLEDVQTGDPLSDDPGTYDANR